MSMSKEEIDRLTEDGLAIFRETTRVEAGSLLPIMSDYTIVEGSLVPRTIAQVSVLSTIKNSLQALVDNPGLDERLRAQLDTAAQVFEYKTYHWRLDKAIEDIIAFVPEITAALMDEIFGKAM